MDIQDSDDSELYLSLEDEQTSMKNQIIYNRSQLMQLIESKDSKPNFEPILHSLLCIDVPLQNKCHSLLINDLLSKNGVVSKKFD